MKNRILVLTVALFSSASVSAAALTCYENETTNAHQCFDPKQVQEKDGIRVTTLYTGGPNGVTKTNFTMNVNCATLVTHLKDRQGVSFAGSNNGEAGASRSLSSWICEATPQGSKRKK